jgi:hypothetical protein
MPLVGFRRAKGEDGFSDSLLWLKLSLALLVGFFSLLGDGSTPAPIPFDPSIRVAADGLFYRRGDFVRLSSPNGHIRS